MTEYKRFKDPVYGYVPIPKGIAEAIIDTESFQRLRRIVQTSYAPLYASAHHNRFVHSIGVYHLGRLASQQLAKMLQKQQQLSEQTVAIVPILGAVFTLACLLHDVGHAPYSHTGEDFFLGVGRSFTELHDRLVKEVNSTTFQAAIPSSQSRTAAPHEITSAVLGLKMYGPYIEDPNLELLGFPQQDSQLKQGLTGADNREFFARCITGYQYSEDESDPLNSIRNCYIQLLNSEIIDVDKLDYLMRDTYVTGFKTTSIDYERLLSALTILREGGNSGQFRLAYDKSAISVLENIVYAHDAERKWIQTHPVVLYENYLLHHIMKDLREHLDTESHQLFSLESLTPQGTTLQKETPIRLLCDDDIVYLSKNVYSSPAAREYYSRGTRRHPVWKSEAEYRALVLKFAPVGEFYDRFNAAMQSVSDVLLQSTETMVIDSDFIRQLEKDIEALEQRTGLEEVDEESLKVQLENKQRILAVTHCLEDFANKKDIPVSFVILSARQFQSGFGNDDFETLPIVFFDGDGSKPFREIVPAPEMDNQKRSSNSRKDFYYLFYKRKAVNERLSDDDAAEIGEALFQAACSK